MAREQERGAPHELARLDVSRAALDRHAQRRRQGLPTITALFGEEAPATASWADWAEETRRFVVACEARGLADIVNAVLRHDRMDAVRESLAARVAASRGQSPIDWWCAFSAKPPEEQRLSLRLAADALLAKGEASAARLVPILAPGGVDPCGSSVDGLELLAACRDLAQDQAPALFLRASQDPLGAARLAASIAERAPQVDVCLCLAASRGEALGSLPERILALLREGALRVPAATSPSNEKHHQTEGSGTPARGAAPEDGARSDAERRLHRALERCAATRGLFALNGSLPVFFGARPAEIDLLCTSLRLAVEVDGYHHFQHLESYRRDRRKDVLLQKDGYIVIRVLADDVMTRLEDVVNDVRALVEHRRTRREPHAVVPKENT